MKRKRLLLICLIAICFSVHGQVLKKKLIVYSITEYIDGYVIRAIDKVKNDTLVIISEKKEVNDTFNFERITVGRTYEFEFEDVISRMSATPVENFVIRIKTTVVWKNGDAVTSIPVYATNTNGSCIKRL